MAIKKIEMRPEGSNDYADILYPKTSVDMVVDLERYGTASGTNTYSVTIPNTPSLTIPLRVTVKFTNANTGNSTLNVNGLGAKTIVGTNRSHIPVGALKAGGIYSLLYDGTYFQLLGEGGEYGNAQASHVLTPYTIGTQSGLVTGTMPNRGSLAQTLTTQNGQYNIPAGYYSGGSVKATFANLVAGNIKSGVNIGGVVGNLKSFSNVTHEDEIVFSDRSLTISATSATSFIIIAENSNHPDNYERVIIYLQQGVHPTVLHKGRDFAKQFSFTLYSGTVRFQAINIIRVSKFMINTN